MSLCGTDRVVSREEQPLLDIECSGKSGNRFTRSPTEGDRLRGQLNAGAMTDRGELYEIPRVEGADCGSDTCDGLQQEN